VKLHFQVEVTIKYNKAWNFWCLMDPDMDTLVRLTPGTNTDTHLMVKFASGSIEPISESAIK